MLFVSPATACAFHNLKRSSNLRKKKKLIANAKRVVGRGLFLGAVFFVLYIFLFGNYGVYRMWKQKKEIEQLEQTLEALRLRQEQLKLEAHLLENDPEYIEKIAREEYGMMKKGEIIYKIVPTSEEKGGKERESGNGPSNEERPRDP